MKFKIGISGDLLNSKGKPCFGDKPLERINVRDDIHYEWLDPELQELSPNVASMYDGILLNLPVASKYSVERDDCRLKIIARFGVGYDSVDVEAMKKNNIIVTNTPNAVKRPVAVASLAMILALSAKIFEKDKLVRENHWKKRTDNMGVGLSQKTLGIVGCGNIGTELINISSNLFKKIIAFDPYVSEEEMLTKGAIKTDLYSLAKISDFIVILCTLNEKTINLIDKKFFNYMKNTAFFVNMSRGKVVDELALINALENKLINGCGLDVMVNEPLEMNNKLLAQKNTILTPHSLCWTDECFENIAIEALDSILNFVDRKKILNQIN